MVSSETLTANPFLGAVTATSAPFSIRTYTDATSTEAGSENVALCVPSAAQTFYLPKCSSRIGQLFIVKKMNSSFVNTVNIKPARIDSPTTCLIDTSTSFLLATNLEYVVLLSTGIKWIVVAHDYDRSWQTFTVTGTWTANVTYSAMFQRHGSSAQFHIVATCSAAPTPVATTLTFTLPVGLVGDSTQLAVTQTDATNLDGCVVILDSGVNAYFGVETYLSSATGVIGPTVGVASATYGTSAGIVSKNGVGSGVPFDFAANDSVSARFWLPITGWKG